MIEVHMGVYTSFIESSLKREITQMGKECTNCGTPHNGIGIKRKEVLIRATWMNPKNFMLSQGIHAWKALIPFTQTSTTAKPIYSDGRQGIEMGWGWWRWERLVDHKEAQGSFGEVEMFHRIIVVGTNVLHRCMYLLKLSVLKGMHFILCNKNLEKLKFMFSFCSETPMVAPPQPTWETGCTETARLSGELSEDATMTGGPGLNGQACAGSLCCPQSSHLSPVSSASAGPSVSQPDGPGPGTEA